MLTQRAFRYSSFDGNQFEQNPLLLISETREILDGFCELSSIHLAKIYYSQYPAQMPILASLRVETLLTFAFTLRVSWMWSWMPWHNKTAACLKRCFLAGCREADTWHR